MFKPHYRREVNAHGNLDHIGGGNLLKRNLDAIGGGNLVRRNLDDVDGDHLLRSLPSQSQLFQDQSYELYRK
jgi:hypothetical protein